MKFERDNRAGFLGTAFFLLLFFFFVNTGNEGSIPDNSPSSCLVADYVVHPISAEYASFIKLPAYNQRWVSSEDKYSFFHFSPPLKVSCDNLLSGQLFNRIEHEELLTRPIVCYHYYYRLFLPDNPELPELS